jgi:hypothetical protein
MSGGCPFIVLTAITAVIAVITEVYHFINYNPTYKILTNDLVSRLTPHAEGITGDDQYGFRHNKSTAYHIIYISQICKKEMETL